MRQQSPCLWSLSGFRLHLLVQLLDSLVELRIQTKQFISSLRGVFWQGQILQASPPRPQSTAPCLLAGHDGVRSPAVYAAIAFASSPIDVGPVIRFAGPVV